MLFAISLILLGAKIIFDDLGESLGGTKDTAKCKI